MLSSVAQGRSRGQILVGFAAEHGAGAIEYGRGKLARKGLDVVVVNDISNPEIGFDVSDNEVTILAADGARRDVSRTSKQEVARAVLDEVERLRATSTEGTGPRAGTGSAARVRGVRRDRSAGSRYAHHARVPRLKT